ncbi:secA translation cis-regulator SecM [Xenorhabdus bovienii]|uniref:Secretion monitor n=1 Tax=Xenorhabdus bovienii str. kraussei Becker Underwood TaxID=1398204 RepID=A0A077PXX7_XENBV|nr:secA translation cis-regulator SecM [Xenorhabdus bovienii]MDE1475456.1 secA translation cis-regulator SecM [Xenorhabdus bovienii]MDE9436558.1 secA translation cis-regulator SecM [Xenorhabdus bovienii]MDE9458645.1 secA translation cis-regulator SecM [Xenorhabdus bovienii]MDE9465337.1 secA translation cis-regulator SecM [Xenorhabdus bovienii]MDE9486084.1 secA translation cis-regulator SecM [Xenorhabdus bovienii]
MSILNLWRQFGRRYFWSHLLLGMVATGIGVPAVLAGTTESLPHSNTSSSQRNQNQAFSSFDHLFQLQSVQRQPSNHLNYWQQHAVRNVIRRLSFAFSITDPIQHEVAKESIRFSSPCMQQLMLDTLHAMLIQAPSQFESILDIEITATILPDSHTPALWVAKTQGIRAGPTANHLSLL